LDELKRWVMQYGAHVEVLEPESFRRSILREVEELMSLYGCEKPEIGREVFEGGSS
jgi:predicted DNA-binding transcriptional regulator YafY